MRLTDSIRSAFIRAAMADVPKVDYDEQIRSLALKLAAAKLPPKVRALWNDKELRGFVAVGHFYCGHAPLQLPGLSAIVETEIEAGLAPLQLLHREQSKSIDELTAKLRSVAYSVSTRKALLDALPEFEKYLPADEVAVNRSMPAVAGVVTAFMLAGWPKGHANTPLTQ